MHKYISARILYLDLMPVSPFPENWKPDNPTRDTAYDQRPERHAFSDTPDMRQTRDTASVRHIRLPRHTDKPHTRDPARFGQTETMSQ